MYRAIHTHLWSDPKVRRLTVSGRLLFVYLIASPQSDISGIYNLSFAAAAEHTGLSQGQVTEALRELSGARLIDFDFEVGSVWIVNMYRHQSRGPKLNIHISRHLQTVHSKRLAIEFKKTYEIPDTVSKGYAFKKSEPHRDTLSIGNPQKEREMERDREMEQEREKKRKKLLSSPQTELFKTAAAPKPGKVPERRASGAGAVKPAFKYSEEFESCWSEYPRRDSKGDAFRAYEKAKKTWDGPVRFRDAVLMAIKARKATNQWIRDGGQFVPYFATFLNRRMFDDPSPPAAGAENPNGPQDSVDRWVKGGQGG